MSAAHIVRPAPVWRACGMGPPAAAAAVPSASVTAAQPAAPGPPMPIDNASHIASELVQLLHQGAAADEFARRLAVVEAMPGAWPGKSNLTETVRMAMAVRNRLELLLQREHGMLAVIESAQDLSGRLDRSSLLTAIVARARNLLGSDLAWLSVLEPEHSRFRALVTEGALAPGTGTMVAGQDRGVVSVVMSTRMPFVTPDYLHDSRFVHDARLDQVFREEGIAALAGVPLMWEGEVIGLLFVADRYNRVHPAQNIAILCTLATHAAVALKNARDFERLNAAFERADQARAELEHHLRNTQAAAEAHAQMTSLLARGATLPTLARAVAQSLDASLLVLDEGAQVLCRAEPDEGPSALAAAYSPHGQRSAELARALSQSRQQGRSVPAYTQDGESCRVMSVIGGHDVLGALALFHRGELGDVAVRTFERSSSVIGIELLSQERVEARKSQGVAALLRALLSQRQEDAGELGHRAAGLGIDLTRPLALLLLTLEGPSAGYAARNLRAWPELGPALVDEVDGELVVLCAATRAPELRQTLLRWVRGELRAPFRGVLSRPVPTPGEVPVLHATLRRALVVLGRIGVRDHIVGQNEMALYSTLFETHDRSSLASFLESTVGPLLAHDRKRQGDLAATLLCFFDQQRSAKATAERLGIHVNTVRQRLSTIEDLIGPWGLASRALELHIALRLWQLGEAAA